MSLTGDPPYGDLVCGIPIHWQWNLIGLRYGRGLDAEGDNTCLIVIVPYWSITITLASLSIWLLLGKSRKSNQMKFDEPVAAEGK